MTSVAIALAALFLVIALLLVSNTLNKSLQQIRSELYTTGVFTREISDHLEELNKSGKWTDVIAKLRQFAATPMSDDINESEVRVYKIGLDDGMTTLAQLILEKIEESK